MRTATFVTYVRPVALLAGVMAGTGTVHAGDSGDATYQLAQMTELEQLHAAFHRAVSVHDPVNGDSAAEITQRIRDVLALWSDDGVLTVVNSSLTAGNYVGKGDPDDPATCPPPSGDTSATGKQGTLCTVYKFNAGGLQQTHKWVSLSPAYSTKFVLGDDDARDTASVYFECHYFDVSLDPTTSAPLWAGKSHVNLTGEARKVDGRWLFWHMHTSTVGVPLP